jgi:hypothetical protein
VSARDAAGNWGAFSVARSFTLNVLLSPLDNAVLYTTTPSLSPYLIWAGVPSATSYIVQIDDAPDFSLPLVHEKPLGNVSAYLVSPALPLGVYYWQVLPTDYEPSNPVYRKFTISPYPPAAPLPVSPAYGAYTNDSTPEFTWNATTSTLGSPFTYDLQVDNDPYFRSPEVNETSLSDTFYTPLTPLPDGLYYWRLRTLNFLDVAGVWSALRPFTVDTTPPGAPTLYIPADNATVSASRPTLYWYAVATATRYRLQVDNDLTFSDPLVIDTETPYTYYTATLSLPQGTYHWRVSARDAARAGR